MRWILAGVFLGMALQASPEAFDALRNGDIAGLMRALDAGASPNAKDEHGGTLLMHAVLYLPVDGVRQLLDRGADANLPGKSGTTALIAAAGDPAKVRLLIERGADVNARSAGGNTALRHAIGIPAGKGTALFLLSKGAKPDERDLTSAVRRSDAELVRALLDAGAPVGEETIRAGLGDAVILPLLLRKAPEFATEDAQRKAVASAPTGTATDLMIAAYRGQVERLRALIKLGADLSARDTRQRTALMYAAGSEEPQPQAVRVLLASGADASAKDARGDTALDLALQRGHRQVIEALGGKPGKVTDLPLAGDSASRPVTQALASALLLLDQAGPQFYKINGCVSCHSQSIPQMAAAFVRPRGLAVNEPVLREQADAVTQTLKLRENALWQIGGVGGGYIATLSYDVVGLTADGRARTIWSDLAVNCLAKAQSANGAWSANDFRHPLGNNDAKYTALSIRALATHTLPGLKVEYAERIAKGAAFLEAVNAEDAQSLSFRMLGLKWAGRPAAITALAKKLEALQRSNGGWAQNAEMAADAYATAIAVWALHEGAGLGDSAWQRGASYLRRTQGADGSWHVRSRGFGFQPYRESGFPHGHDQWLSSATTGFAILALAPLL